MPRDGSGVYSLPPGTTVAPNTTIESSWANALTADLAQDANTDRPVVAGGTGASTAADAATNLTVVSYGSSQTLSASQQSTARSNVSAALKGHIYGLTLSNNSTDATNDIDIAAGEAASTETNPVLMVLASALTKRLDAAWAVGTNQGMLATGAAVADTTYHIFLIRRTDTGVVDVAADTSVTGANIAANTNAAYTQIRRIGSIYRVAGSNVSFTQRGDEFLLKSMPVDQSASTFGTTHTNIQLSLPSGLQIDAIVNLSCQQAALRYVLIYSPDQNDIVASSSNFTIFNLAGTYGYGYGRIRTNTSAQIRAVSSGASTQIQVATVGWVDTRGRP